MKRNVLKWGLAALLITGASISSYAQLKVNSDGRVYLNGTAPVSAALDGALTIKNLSSYERALMVRHHSDLDWSTAVRTSLNRTNSTTYGVALNGISKFYVAGAGWIYSNGNYLGSDSTLKTEIKPLENASLKINSLRGITYKYKNEVENSKLFGENGAPEHMGLIAQDVEKVAPQAVKTVHDGTKAVCYEVLVGLLVEGFKEQSNQIDKLTRELKTIENTPQEVQTVKINDSYIKQNIPNPTSSDTKIEYSVPVGTKDGAVIVFDMTGKLIKSFTLNQTKGEVLIKGEEFGSGLFHYSLIVEGKVIETKKMLINL